MTADHPRHRPIPKLPRAERHRIRPDGCNGPLPEGVLRGIEQVNRGEYWECHETLEDAWRAEPGDVRYLYQGILLVAVGLLHGERGNRHGALAKLESGIELLTPFDLACRGVDVAGLRADASLILAALRSANRLDELALPKARCKVLVEPREQPRTSVESNPDAAV